MPMAHYMDDGREYALSLIDGYILDHAPVPWRHVPPWHKRALEDGMAEHVARRARKEICHQSHRFAHAWVVGSGSWARKAPEPIRSFSDRDLDDHYRLVITGEGCAHGKLSGMLCVSTNDSARAAGMTRMKKHRYVFEYRRHACLLLEAMHKCYLRTRAPPSEILDSLGVPYFFREVSK